MGHSQYSGVVIVCDGTVDTSEKLGRVLFNDPASCAVPMRAVTSQGKAPKTTT
jgi:urocanate hydratase